VYKRQVLELQGFDDRFVSIMNITKFIDLYLT